MPGLMRGDFLKYRWATDVTAVLVSLPILDQALGYRQRVL
jgi:hypothetical protein